MKPFPKLPNPTPENAGRNFVERAAKEAFARIAKRWQPSGEENEPTHATVSRYSRGLIAEDGTVKTAEDMLSKWKAAAYAPTKTGSDFIFSDSFENALVTPTSSGNLALPDPITNAGFTFALSVATGHTVTFTGDYMPSSNGTEVTTQADTDGIVEYRAYGSQWRIDRTSVTAADITDASGSGKAVLTGNPEQGRSALLADDSFAPHSNLIWLKNTRAKLLARTAGGFSPPIHQLIWGDSICTGLETKSIIGDEAIVGYKISPWYSTISGTAPTVTTTGDWISGVVYSHPVGVTTDWKFITTTAIRADRCSVAYLAGTGSFDLQYSINGGAFTTAATIDTSAVTGAGYAEYAITNPYWLPVVVRITNVTTAAVRIIGCGYWLNNAGGVVQSMCSATGITMSDYSAIVQGTYDAVIGGSAPDLIITAWNDPETNWNDAGVFDGFVAKFTSAHATSDWLVLSVNPLNPTLNVGSYEGIDRAKAQIIPQRDWAIRNKQSFVNGYAMFRSYADAVASSFMTAGDDYHLSTSGREFRNRQLNTIINASLGGYGKSYTWLSKTLAISHTGYANSKVEIGDPINSSNGCGLFLRGGNTGNGLQLGSRSSSLGNETAELYYTGTHASGNSKIGFYCAREAKDFLSLQVTGYPSFGGGNIVIGSPWPLAMEMGKVTANPANTAADKVKLFARMNGSSKMEFCAIFPSGAIQVIATEP